jgi:hypothetical protein
MTVDARTAPTGSPSSGFGTAMRGGGHGRSRSGKTSKQKHKKR